MLDSGFKFLTTVGFVSTLGVTGLLADNTGPFLGAVPVPEADIWSYPNLPGGTRQSASTFSALPSTTSGVDDRFAQFQLKFNTSLAITPGLGAANYDPSKVVLTAVLISGDPLAYDSTEDARSTYIASTAPNFTPDTDAGRPIEVFGTGFRNGYTAAGFVETSPTGGNSPGTRNAYPLSYSPAGVARDVSNSVTLGFDSMPWAVAKILAQSAPGEPYVEILPGEIIPPNAHAVFEFNLGLPGVADYIRNSLNQGFIWLNVSSLHSVSDQTSTGFASFFTKENQEQEDFGDVAAFIEISYSLPLKILANQRNAETQTSQLSWNVSPGYQYTVFTTESLASGSWIPLQTYNSTSAGQQSWSGVITPQRAFFRVSRVKTSP